jgi:hypothetical protein
VPKDVADKMATFHVALHHWHQDACKDKVWCVPLVNEAAAKSADAAMHDSYPYFSNPSNEMSTVLSTLGGFEDVKNDPKYKGKYVYAPVNSIKNAQATLNGWKNTARSDRRSSRESSVISSNAPTTPRSDSDSDAYSDNDTPTPESAPDYESSDAASPEHDSSMLLPPQEVIDSALNADLNFSVATQEFIVQDSCQKLSYDAARLSDCMNFIGALTLLLMMWKRKRVQLWNGRHLFICPNFCKPDCQRFTFRIPALNHDVFCPPCYAKHQLELAQQRNKRDAEESGRDHTSSSSSCAISRLSPSRHRLRIVNMARDRRLAKNQVYKLRKKLYSKASVEINKKDKNFVDCLKDMFSYCKKDGDKFKREVVKLLITSGKAYSAGMEAEKEIDEYASSLLCTLENYSRQLSGKKKQCRFNSSVMRTALAF